MSESPSSERPQRAQLVELVREVLLTYSSLLIGLIYPVAMLKLWLQLAKYYTGDSVTAWYAASLVPKTVAMGQALRVVIFVLVASALALLAASLAVAMGFGGGRIKQDEDVQLCERDGKVVDYTIEIKGYVAEPLAKLFRNPLMQNPPSRWGVLVAVLLIGAGIVLLGAYRTADTWEELLFYAGFVLLSAGTGGVAGLLAAYRPTSGRLSFKEIYSPEAGKLDDEFREHRQQFLELAREGWGRSVRRWRRLGLAVAAVGAVFSSLCLIQVTYLFLPSVRFTQGGEPKVIDALALSGSDWQGFDCAGSLVSIPHSEAKDVIVENDSGPPYSHCPVDRVTQPTTLPAPRAPVDSACPASPASHMREHRQAQ